MNFFPNIFLLFYSGYATSSYKVIKINLCQTQLKMKFALLINLKLLKIANSFFLNIAEHETFSGNRYENANKAMKLSLLIDMKMPMKL